MAKTTAIRAPTTDPVNHQIVLRQLKEASETASRLRGNARDSFAQVGELLDAGIVRFADGKLVSPSPSSLPPTVVPSTRQIKTGGSIKGGGTLASDLSLELVGDAGSPGNSMLYGTNASGVKGWYTQPSGATTLSALADVSISSPTNGQSLVYNSTAAKWQNQTISGGGGGSANITPDTHPASPTAWDDEFEYGTALDTTGSRRAGANAWTWVNQNGATTAVAEGALVLTPPTNGGQFSFAGQAPPAAPWTFVAKIAVSITANNAGYGGLLLYNSANGHNVFFGALYNTFAGNLTYAAEVSASWPSGGGATGHTPASGTILASPSLWQIADYAYFQVQYDGTTLTYSISPTGLPGSFVTFYSGTSATDLGAAPTHIGVGGSSYGASAPVLVEYDWFRRTA